MKVTVTASPGSIEPGRGFGALVLVEPNAQQVIDQVRLDVSGLLTSAETVQVHQPGTFTLTRQYVVPVTAGTGQVTLHATAIVDNGAAQAQGTTQVAVADTVAPSVQLVLTPPDSIAQPGDSLTATVNGSDNVGLSAVVVHWSGALTRTDSFAVPNGAPFFFKPVGLRIPSTVALNQTLSVSAQAIDIAGHSQISAVATRRVTDLLPPSVVAGLLNARGTTAYAPGDTLQLTLLARDNVKLARYGYRLGGPITLADSFTVADSLDSRTLALPVTAGWTGLVTVTVFAVDQAGHRLQVQAGTLTVANRTRRAIVSTPIDAAVRDIAIETRRGLVFLSQPDSSRVLVLDGVSASPQAPILFAAGSRPQGLDVTLTGDSLLVALRRTNHLGVVNLNTGVIDTVRVNSDPFLNRGPDNVRVSANGKAVVSITFDGYGYGGSIVTLDLATRAVTSRKTVTELVPICRSGNRARMLILVDDSCCPIEGLVYDAVTDGFVADRGTVSQYSDYGSSDFAGNRYLVNGSIFDALLNSLTTVTPSGYAGSGASVIALDGASGFFATASGVVHARLSDGAVLETFTLGEQPSRLVLSTDGLTLVAAGATKASIIDLW